MKRFKLILNIFLTISVISLLFGNIQNNRLSNRIIERSNLQIKINNFLMTRVKSIEKEYKTIDVENIENIKKANFLIYNLSGGFSGSGTVIKINGKLYILTVSHLIDKETDNLIGYLNNNIATKLELVKINYEKDLALFKIDETVITPYIEVSDQFPKEGSEVIVVGNPDSLIDIITDGIIAKVEENNYLVTSTIFYGNSGGALIYRGKIVGVVSAILPYYKYYENRPAITVNYGVVVKLENIQEFLKGVK